MTGIQIAFRDFDIILGQWKSEWVGLFYFKRFMQSPQFMTILKNTVILSVQNLLLSFPFPIILALLLNQVRSQKLRSVTQTLIFLPHFISLVVMVSMLFTLLSLNSGVVNSLLNLFGFNSINFMGDKNLFRGVFIGSGVWQSAGYESIIYIATLAGVSKELYLAAEVDGATTFKKILYIDIPSLTPIAVTLFLLRVGKMLNVSFQKALLMQTATNLDTSEILGTYIYKVGLVNAQFSYSTAIDIFQTLINLLLLLFFNQLSKKITKSSLW